MNNFKKNWLNSLSFLDNCIVNWTIVIVLLLYCSNIFGNINNFVGNLYNLSIIRIIVLLLIVYVAPKDTTIAVLLALTYIISIFYMANSENFYSDSNESIKLNENSNLVKNMDVENSMRSNVMPNSDRLINNDKDRRTNMNIESFAERSSHVMTPKGQTNKKDKKGGFTNMNTEHFFPLQNSNYSEESRVNQNLNQNVLNDTTCLQTYVPVNEQVGDVCNPTSTFKNEFNAQGLNYPEGFNHNISGSPLDV